MSQKEEELTYLQMPLPEGGKRSRLTKVSFHGLNLAQQIDTGLLCDEMNISTTYAPYLTPTPQPELVSTVGYNNQADRGISLHAFEDVLIAIVAYSRIGLADYPDEFTVRLVYLYPSDLSDYDYSADSTDLYTGGFDSYLEDKYLNPRSIVRFNVYDSDDPISGKYDKKLLIFPDQKSMDYNTQYADLDFADLGIHMQSFDGKKYSSSPPDTADKSYYQYNTTADDNNSHQIWYWGRITSRKEGWVECSSDFENGYPACPGIDYATVYVSRLFGVGNGKVYASGFNDYANWNLDTADEYNESNAWVSNTQSSSEADSPVTGICTYQSHVIVFKKNFMHEIYNTKNPFRVQDIFNEGCIDGRTVQDVDGRLIFLSEDNVKIYSGSNPTNIGYPLGIERFGGEDNENAVAGTDGRKYYLCCDETSPEREENICYVYDTYCEQWAVQKMPAKPIGFAHNNRGMYMMGENGEIYKLDTDTYDGVEWRFETDNYDGESIDIKHLNRIQVLCDLREGSTLKIYMVQNGETYDSATEPLYETTETRAGEHRRAIRFVPRKTAGYGFRLHFEGTGYIKIYSLEMIISDGGDKFIE